MSKPLLILALLAAGYFAYTELGPGLPGQGLSLRPSGDGRNTPAAPGIVTGGLGEAARGSGD